MTLASDGLYNAKAYKYTYADATARAAATGFTAVEVGVLALQLDDLSLWILADDSPVTWSAAAGTAGMTNPMTTAGDVIVGGASGTPTRVAKGGNNTVFGVDGSGTLGYKADPVGGAVVVDEVELAADATTVRFPVSGSLPTGYAAWQLIINGRGTGAAADVNVDIQLNGDTASNYDWLRHLANSGSHGVGVSRGTDRISMSAIPAASATANKPGLCEITIGDPENTTFHKVARSKSADITGTAADANLSLWENGGTWRSTAAITSILVITPLKAGSRLTLIGIKKLAGGARTS